MKFAGAVKDGQGGGAGGKISGDGWPGGSSARARGSKRTEKDLSEIEEPQTVSKQRERERVSTKLIITAVVR